jgi:hypothetical protein
MVKPFTNELIIYHIQRIAELIWGLCLQIVYRESNNASELAHVVSVDRQVVGSTDGGDHQTVWANELSEPIDVDSPGRKLPSFSLKTKMIRNRGREF